MANEKSVTGNLRIGELARRSGISIDTLRYYERCGLLPEVPRTVSGYRLYDQCIMDRLGFIKRAQSFGFTLNEIKMMLQLERASPKTCSRVLPMLANKLDDLNRRHKEIVRLKRELSLFKTACEQSLANGGSCPVIEDFVRSFPGGHQKDTALPISVENTGRVKEILHSACGLSLLPERLSQLSDKEDRIRRFVLDSYPKLGRAPKLQEIRTAFPGYTSEQIEGICRKLADLDIVYIPKGSKELAGAYPFTDFRKDHCVRFLSKEALKPVYAMCAIDALGIPFMYGKDVEIESSCGQCAQPIRLTVWKKKIVSCDPPGTAVFAGLGCSDHAAISFCPSVLFFCSDSHIKRWHKKQNQLSGTRLSLGEALALGKALFQHR